MALSRDAEVEALLAKQAIAEVVYRYARAIDRCDEPLLRSCFHADSTHEHGEFKGNSADFCGWAMDLLSGLVATQHHIGNVLIDVEGDKAYSESYWVAYHRIPAQAGGAGIMAGRGEETDYFVGGRYLDRFERRAGTWKIARRVGVHDWQRYDPASDGGFFDTPASQRGARGTKDQVYHLK
jgi:hypothetical protein